MAVYKMTAYPKDVNLGNGEVITVRPMVPEDGDAILRFFLRVPEEDRYYLKEDVTSPAVIKQWTDNLSYARVLPLLAFAGDRIVGDGTLHRRRAGATKHMGEIRIVVEPDFRKRGVGTALMRELIAIAKDSDLEKLVFELVQGEQDAAVGPAKALGFVSLATIPGHVRDIRGRPHDLLILELLLGKWQEWWEF